MAASISISVIDGAPGNVITVPGSGLAPGFSANVKLGNQGVNAPPGLSPSSITLPATFATDGSNVQIGPLPDGIMDGVLTITAGDLSTATCPLRTVSQYVQAVEYVGEGTDVSSLAPGELDTILKRASAMVDRYMGDSLRQLQVLERPKYRARRNGPPKIYPYRVRGRTCPIISVDQLVFVSASDLVTVFNLPDLYVNGSLNYIEVLAYAIGNYALLGELEVIGYSANVLELSYTSGYPMAQYPIAVREATLLTATMLLNRRQRQAAGFGIVSKFQDQLTMDPNSFKMPPEAKQMLAPHIIRTLS